MKYGVFEENLLNTNFGRLKTNLENEQELRLESQTKKLCLGQVH